MVHLSPIERRSDQSSLAAARIHRRLCTWAAAAVAGPVAAMTVQLDNFDPEEKRQYVLVGVTIGLFLSTTSTALRIWAKLISTKTLRGEDCFMCAALFGCIGTAICMYYSQSSLQPCEALSRQSFQLDLTVTFRPDHRVGTTRA